MATPSTTTDPRPWEGPDWAPTHELVAQALYESDWRHQLGLEPGDPWPTNRRITWDDLAGPRGEEVRGNYLRLARASIAAIRRGDDLPDPDDLGDQILDADRVARIAWAYDPAGTIYNDIHRLARSHENQRRELNASRTLVALLDREADQADGTEFSLEIAASVVADLRYLVGYLAERLAVHGPTVLIEQRHLEVIRVARRDANSAGIERGSAPISDTAP